MAKKAADYTIIAIDVSDNLFPKDDKSPILRQVKVKAISDYFKDGKLNRRKIPRIKGYQFIWYDNPWVKSDHLFLAYARK